MDCQPGLRLELEERIVENSIVDVDLAHLGLHALLHALPQALVRVVRALAHLSYSGRLDEVRQLKGGFVKTTLVLKEFAFLTPVLRNGH